MLRAMMNIDAWTDLLDSSCATIVRGQAPGGAFGPWVTTALNDTLLIAGYPRFTAEDRRMASDGRQRCSRLGGCPSQILPLRTGHNQLQRSRWQVGE